MGLTSLGGIVRLMQCMLQLGQSLPPLTGVLLLLPLRRPHFTEGCQEVGEGDDAMATASMEGSTVTLCMLNAPGNTHDVARGRCKFQEAWHDMSAICKTSRSKCRPTCRICCNATGNCPETTSELLLCTQLNHKSKHPEAARLLAGRVCRWPSNLVEVCQQGIQKEEWYEILGVHTWPFILD